MGGDSTKPLFFSTLRGRSCDGAAGVAGECWDAGETKSWRNQGDLCKGGSLWGDPIAGFGLGSAKHGIMRLGRKVPCAAVT